MSHPSSEFNKNDESDTSTLQPIQTLQKLTAELSEEDDTVQNQPIHWLAAVICVNTGNFVTAALGEHRPFSSRPDSNIDSKFDF